MPRPKNREDGPNPLGLCWCDCGKKTKLSPQTNASTGDVAGTHRRYLRGHHPSYKKTVVTLLDDGASATISLSRGQVAIVDVEDLARVLKHGWSARPANGVWYAGGRMGLLHRFIMNATAGVIIDHKNLNTLDCRKSNLRRADRSQSVWNRGPLGVKSHPYKGIWQTANGRWVARIGAGNRSNHLGRFDTPEEAARAYDEAARELHGEFARTNF